MRAFCMGTATITRAERPHGGDPFARMTCRVWRASLMIVCVASCGENEKHSAATSSAAQEITTADLTPSPSGGPPIIAPRLLEPRRVAGEKNVTPDSDVITAAASTGATLRGAFKYCLDESGRVVQVTTVQSTQAVNYDAKIARSIKEWAFRPVIVDGKSIAVCSAASFVFSAR